MSENRENLVTKKDLLAATFKWYMFAWQCVNYERFVSLGFTSSINHILAKLYKDEEELKEALTRHMEFFNTEPYIGVVILGIVVAMEEERAAKGEEVVPAESITTVKTGLMGPLAGIGDTINQSILYPLFLAIGCGLTLDNNLGLIGPLVFIILSCGSQWLEAWYFAQLGYRFGRDAITKILAGGTMDKIIHAAGIVGCMVMGALTVNYVSLATGITFGSGDSVVALQSQLDAILPSMLPLLVVLLCTYLFKKGATPTKVMGVLIVLVTVLAIIGIC